MFLVAEPNGIWYDNKEARARNKEATPLYSLTKSGEELKKVCMTLWSLNKERERKNPVLMAPNLEQKKNF